jgi:hypothetical protein
LTNEIARPVGHLRGLTSDLCGEINECGSPTILSGVTGFSRHPHDSVFYLVRAGKALLANMKRELGKAKQRLQINPKRQNSSVTANDNVSLG